MHELYRIAEKQHGLVTREQALAGFAEDHLEWLVRSSKLEAIAARVYRIPGSVPTWRQRLLGTVLAAGPGAAASHLSAAALWRLPGFREGPVQVTRPRGRHHSGLIGTVHETTFLPERHRRQVDGISLTSPALTLLHLCARLRSPARAARTLDNALGMKLVSIPDVELLLAEAGRRGRPGTRLMRLLMTERGAGYVPTESELEDLVVAVLAEAGITGVERQVVLGSADQPIGRVDVYIRRARLIIEAQSRRFHGEWLDTVADEERRAAFIAAGFAFIPVTWQQLVTDPRTFLAAVFTVLEAAA